MEGKQCIDLNCLGKAAYAQLQKMGIIKNPKNKTMLNFKEIAEISEQLQGAIADMMIEGTAEFDMYNNKEHKYSYNKVYTYNCYLCISALAWLNDTNINEFVNVSIRQD